MRHLAAVLGLLALPTFVHAQHTCCSATGLPGCSDSSCASAVCQFDPACCSAAWDQRCADEASVLCPACRDTQGCLPPVANRAAFEPCGATIDDSCPDPLQPLDALLPGEVVSGQVLFNEVRYYGI